jgi:hypothetical protein
MASFMRGKGQPTREIRFTPTGVDEPCGTLTFDLRIPRYWEFVVHYGADAPTGAVDGLFSLLEELGIHDGYGKVCGAPVSVDYEGASEDVPRDVLPRGHSQDDYIPTA